jgi:Mrp family chromosome partitioning ATPase
VELAKGETIMKTVALVNNKGRVGKTTSAVKLAALHTSGCNTQENGGVE